MEPREEEVEVVSLIEHRYAGVVRPAGTKYHAEKRLLARLVTFKLAKEAHPEVAPAPSPQRARSRRERRS